ncbi:hypothetical protein [Sporosarcina pasteurii]|uniref:Lipoprotein n=1 Tax=Sporosarcina pasteurii TaxID=1474 RepID=A0A380C3T4_SPOPA|nr:hypothetical protein [Sporosarcina pasteurii]MDS9471557.1 hypothetical protein [Sporosarcina pasteurii]QBQ04828.1 hypothetical protein E2C16_03685 [Sporosarcina pasteurii]SUJ11069.1 Uncharacterised protein [Sporosarcina pasteurii]
MKKLMMVMLALVTLAACSPGGKKLTIEPYKLSEKERQLIQRTGVFSIDYFEINGHLDDADLQFSVVVYEDGKLKEELLKMYGMLDASFKNELISFGMFETKNGEEKQQFTLEVGTPGGSLGSSTYETGMTASVYGALIDNKVTLEKEQPLYLAGWAGTTKDVIPTLRGENGQLPENLASYERALLLKVLWTVEK